MKVDNSFYSVELAGGPAVSGDLEVLQQVW